jgi:hypothetical protein
MPWALQLGEINLWSYYCRSSQPRLWCSKPINKFPESCVESWGQHKKKINFNFSSSGGGRGARGDWERKKRRGVRAGERRRGRWEGERKSEDLRMEREERRRRGEVIERETNSIKKEGRIRNAVKMIEMHFIVINRQL